MYLEYLGYPTLLWKFTFIFSSWEVFHKAKHRLNYFWSLCFVFSWNQHIKLTKQFVNLLSDWKCLFGVCSLGLTNPVTQNLFSRTHEHFILSWYPTGLSTSFHWDYLLGLVICPYTNCLSSQGYALKRPSMIVAGNDAETQKFSYVTGK